MITLVWVPALHLSRPEKSSRRTSTSLKDIDLSTFPRCNCCFRIRLKCDGNRSGYSCLKRMACCKEITVVALKESPEFARYILERKQYNCCGGRPCRHCQVAKAICRDVTDDNLNEYPDGARHVLELSSQGPISPTLCRYCAGNGRTCHRASSADSCKTCTRYGRSCSNNLEGVKKKGVYNVQPNTD